MVICNCVATITNNYCNNYSWFWLLNERSLLVLNEGVWAGVLSKSSSKHLWWMTLAVSWLFCCDSLWNIYLQTFPVAWASSKHGGWVLKVSFSEKPPGLVGPFLGQPWKSHSIIIWFIMHSQRPRLEVLRTHYNSSKSHAEGVTSVGWYLERKTLGFG